MRSAAAFEFPPEQQRAFVQARRLEGWSIAYIVSVGVVLYFVQGQSQAMRSAWLDQLISLIPPVAFLVASRVATKRPSGTFAYGFHGAVSIGYLAASLAILLVGGFLLFEAVATAVNGERATIGGMTVFGVTFWAGWPMLAGLAYASIPAFFLGHAKTKLAPKIHDKVLFADAEMNRADWKSQGAAALGVLGIGFGLWWADAAAAALISLDILWDGFRNVRAAVTDLIAEHPKKTVEPSELESLPEELRRFIEREPWVERAAVRMREAGHVFFGEIFLVPRSEKDLVRNISDVQERAKALNWRIHDLVIMPVESRVLDEKPEKAEGGGEQKALPAPAPAIE